MVALPSVADVHGAGAPVLSDEQRWLRGLAGWWWALWLGNLVFVAVAERPWRDTAGAPGA